MDRIALTLETASTIRRLRLGRNLTQYQLADELGWPRSKIKRLEKHEVRTIEQTDLLTILTTLGAFQKKRTPEKPEKPDSKKPALTDAIEIRRKVPRNLPGILFLDVFFRSPVPMDKLRGAPFRYQGTAYRIHGIEHTAQQGSGFEAGDRAVLLLWQPPGRRGPRWLKKPKADKGRPKPRLDYKEGTARVLAALQTAADQGALWQERGELEAATGYGACQVRTFCKVLESQGMLRREGAGRGMKYVLVRSTN